MTDPEPFAPRPFTDEEMQAALDEGSPGRHLNMEIAMDLYSEVLALAEADAKANAEGGATVQGIMESLKIVIDDELTTRLKQ